MMKFSTVEMAFMTIKTATVIIILSRVFQTLKHLLKNT